MQVLGHALGHAPGQTLSHALRQALGHALGHALRHAPSLALACAAGLLGSASPALSATLTVWPGQSLAQAVQRAADGDTIELQAGDHRGQTAVILQRRLTLRGVGGRPVLHADGQHAEGKALLVVRQGDVWIDNIEFRGARVPDGNGAGIRFERGRLRVTRCVFIDNQNGILTANFGDAELSVHDSEFGAAPAGTTLPHLLYVGRIARFELQGSRLSGGREGHLLKSRARVNEIFYNHLVDGPQGRAAYEMEFPNGGLAYVVGNVMGQGPNIGNPALLAFGAEGQPPESAEAAPRAHGLFLVNNTFVNDALWPAAFVRVFEHKLQGKVDRVMVNNLFVGLGGADGAWNDSASGNQQATRAQLRDPEGGDFSLKADSVRRGRGVEPDTMLSTAGRALAPKAEFVPPLGTRELAPRLRWSPGAHQE